jgi:NAD(P)-dependent dehydrogenase (short-subunit alcohol dehydrogenase family)
MSMKKRIVITGVGRGLGRAMSEGFAKAGHQVLGCTRSPESVATLQAQLGTPHDWAVVDVSDDTQVKMWCDRLLAQYGATDLLINNAALINQLRPLWQIEAAEFDRIMDVNIKGIANVIRHFVPAMIAQGSGVIVNFSSGWGRSTSPEVAPYCATKWAVEGLTLALAQELPTGMAAIPLNPGIIHTDMLDICFGGEARYYPSAHEWAAKAVPFLLKLSPRDNGKSLTVPGVAT